MAFSFGEEFNKYTCHMCNLETKKGQTIGGIKLSLICKVCAMTGFKHKRQACFRGKVVNEILVRKNMDEIRNNIEKDRMEGVEQMVRKMEKKYPVRSYNDVVCEHSWGNPVLNNGPMTLSESILGDFLFENKKFEITDREFWIKKMMNVPRTGTRAMVAHGELAPMASFVHPADPVMALGYMMRKFNDFKPGALKKSPDKFRQDLSLFKIGNTKESLKEGFSKNADLLESVVKLEGVRVASFLYDNKHRSSEVEVGIHAPEPEYSSAFSILDKSFAIIDSDKLLRSELSEIMGGSGAADKLLSEKCFTRMLKQFSPGVINPEKGRVSKIAKEMVAFSKSTLEQRKKKMYMRCGRSPDREMNITKCWATGRFAKMYISGETFCEVDVLKKYFWNLTYNGGMFSYVKPVPFFDY